MEPLSTIQKLIIWAPPILFAITLHEVAHGRTALHYGDTTAKMLGRLSLNPLKHVDPIGTVIVPLMLFFTSGFIFGWAKPVPVSMRNLRNPRHDMAMVALAGPMANLVMAVGWAMIMGISLATYASIPSIAEPLFYMGSAGISINVVLAVLNMLPFPPLDGSRLLAGIVPERFARQMDQIEPYGLIILVVLMVSGVLWKILGPPVDYLSDLFHQLAMTLFT